MISRLIIGTSVQLVQLIALRNCNNIYIVPVPKKRIINNYYN
jgi:hypothetical protein